MVQKKTKDKDKETGIKQKAKQSKKSTSSKKTSIDKKLNELKEQNVELNDKFLRLYSEFDNYRKRTIKEKIELQKSASRDLIEDLLPVLDDFERAMQAFKENDDSDVYKGIELIYNKLYNTLSQKGLKPMNSLETDFNTDYHEAITKIEAGDEQKGKVVDVIQKGYLLNDKVLRFAKVVVGS